MKAICRFSLPVLQIIAREDFIGRKEQEVESQFSFADRNGTKRVSEDFAGAKVER
jgi:hypothetical protein